MFMMISKRGALQFGTVVGIFGTILIAAGVAWLIAQNWHQLAAAVKILILVLATGGAFFSATRLDSTKHYGLAKAVYLLGSLLYTLSVFLIAQIFSTSTSSQGMAWLLLLSWAGMFFFAYTFSSSASIVAGMVAFSWWLFIQTIAFFEASQAFPNNPAGIFTLFSLSTGVLLYGVGLLHRSWKHSFSCVYQWWTAF